jgi:hypothetical protein
VNPRPIQDLWTSIIEDGKKRGQGYDDLEHLASITSSVGFEDVRVDAVSSDRVSDMRPGYNTAILGGMKGMMDMFNKADGGKGYWSSEQPVKMFENATKEVEGGGAYFRTELNVFTGRKGR